MPAISRLLSHHARYRGEYTALVFGDAVFDFTQLNRLVNQTANALIAAGLRKGDCFATVLPNSVELMVAYWAAAASGTVIVPCSNLLTANSLQTLLADADCKLIITNSMHVPTMHQLRQLLPQVANNCFVTTDTDGDELLRSWNNFIGRADTAAPDIIVEPDDIYNIMYSSGTTGLPKGIIHTHCIRSMYCTLFANAWRMTPESVVLHAGAIVFNGAMLDLMPWMYLGCKYVLHPKFDPEKMIEDIQMHRATHLVMVPTQIIAILNSPDYHPDKLASVEMLQNVGAPLHLRYKNLINEQLPDRFYELYGVTEGFMTVLDRTESVRKAGSVGKPAAFTELCILDLDGEPCPAGAIGEICGKGPMVMPGYHNRPDLTEQAFINGWLRSGDLGYLDEDGYLFLVDRKKDMIISGGVNVYPKDIEEIVIRHPSVNEAAVFGVDSDKWGEVPIAAITVSQEASQEEIAEWVNQRVDARFQQLAGVAILDDFPRNIAGKILKRELREQYRVGIKQK